MTENQTNWHRRLLWIAVALFAIPTIVMPIGLHLFGLYGTRDGFGGTTVQSLVQVFFLRLTEAILALIAFSFGASIGSFLNVVAYRIPKKLSIISNPSHCPNCGHRIQSKDNLPILGWILLQGKCRNCSEPISPRYPIVEAIAGGIFLFLFLVQLTSGGANLPFREPNFRTGVLWTILETKWDLVAICLYHAALFLLLLTMALFDFDRQPVPRRVLLFALTVLIVPSLLMNGLIVVPFDYLNGPLRPEISESAKAAVTMLIGGMAGYLMGGLYCLTMSDASHDLLGPRFLSAPPIVAITLIGIALGWQSVVAVSILYLLIHLVGAIPMIHQYHRAIPATGWILVATTIHHVFWRTIYMLDGFLH